MTNKADTRKNDMRRVATLETNLTYQARRGLAGTDLASSVRELSQWEHLSADALRSEMSRLLEVYDAQLKQARQLQTNQQAEVDNCTFSDEPPVDACKDLTIKLTGRRVGLAGGVGPFSFGRYSPQHRTWLGAHIDQTVTAVRESINYYRITSGEAEGQLAHIYEATEV